MVAMSSAAQTETPAQRGERRQREREAQRFQDPQSPVRRFVAAAAVKDWTTPREFDVAYSQPLLLTAAAKRRRLTTMKMPHSYRTFSADGTAVGGHSPLATSLVSDFAKRACRARPVMASCLESMSVPTPRSRAFSVDAAAQAWSWAAELYSGAVVKPATNRHAGGVSWGIDSEEDFHCAWEHARASRVKPLYASGEIVVEEHIPGLDVRAYVIGEEVVAALVRLPLFIQGDSRSTVRELAEGAVQARSGNPYFAETSPAVDDDALRELLLDPGEVLEGGEMRAVSGSSNPLRGGITVDITEQLSTVHRESAIDAVWAIPGLRSAGVDLLVPEVSGEAPGRVIDVTDDADIALHRCPSFGTGRRVAEDVVAQMIQRAKP